MFSYTLLILYFLAFGIYFIDVKSNNKILPSLKRLSLFGVLILHLIYLFYLFSKLRHFPIENKSELFTVIAFSVTLVYFIIELLTDIHGTGFLILLFSFLFQTLSILFFNANSPSAGEINRYIGIHIIVAISGYVGFTISAAYGVMYIILFSKLKKNRFDAFFNRLPNLEILSKLSITAFYIGFGMLTLSLILGIIWLPRIFPERGFTDPKVLLTGFVWLFYSVIIFLNVFKIIYGKKFIYFSLAAFGILIVASGITTLLTNSFHSF